MRKKRISRPLQTNYRKGTFLLSFKLFWILIFANSIAT
jgi:hypothetical protein